MDIDERIKKSLMILIDKDRAEDFASIVSYLSKNYSIMGCLVPIDRTATEQKVSTWNTEQDIVNLVRSYCNDHTIAWIVFHKSIAQRFA